MFVHKFVSDLSAIRELLLKKTKKQLKEILSKDVENNRGYCGQY